MSRFVALGEVLLRLKSPDGERLLQTPAFEASFGGAEANVAVSLANFGLNASLVTALPQNAIGDAALGELRRFGVDVAGVVRSGDRVGIYFLEAGESQRPTRVVYDRSGSALATIAADRFDWKAVFADAGWLHISGITPALSATAAELTLEACRQAKRLGATISCDLNYRSKLWQYGKAATEVMPGIFRLVDVGIGGREDFRLALGIPVDAEPRGPPGLEDHAGFAASIMRAFPNLATLAITLRATEAAGEHTFSACLQSGAEFIVAPRAVITASVGRVGAGDAFAAGLIYGLHRFADRTEALAFATAAARLKHTIAGDFNRVSIAEVEQFLAGHTAGRVQR